MNTAKLKDALTAIVQKLVGWANALIDMVPNLAVALVVTVVAVLLSRTAARLVRGLLRRLHVNPAGSNLFSRVVQLGTVMAGLLIALSILQLDKAVTSLLAGVGILGLALGFAFQDLASNFVSGVALSLNARYPFRVGDLIDTNGVLGVAEQTFLRNTIIRTLDGNAVVMPNKKVFEEQLTNYTAEPYRRVPLSCGVSYGEDLRKVKELVLATIQGMECVLSEKPVEFFWTGFGESSIDFEVRFWIAFHRQPEFLEARSEAIMRIKAAFDEHGVVIPFPIRTLDFGIKGGTRLDELSAPSLQLSSGERAPKA